MNYFEKRKLKSMLQSCNYTLAGEIIHSKFASASGQNALTELIAEYRNNPGFEMALRLMEYEPQLTIYFVECNPEGFYSRQMQKKMIDTQEHQAFLSHLGGDPLERGMEEAAATSVKASKKRQLAAAPEPPPPLPPRAKSGKAGEEDPLKLALPEGRDFSNVIQTLQDSIRELQLQVIECEQELKELERKGSEKAEMRRRWLSLCKDGVKEFETAIRVLQAVGESR